MRKEIEEGIAKDKEKEKLRQEAQNLVAAGVAGQIRDQRQRREREFTRRRQVKLRLF